MVKTMLNNRGSIRFCIGEVLEDLNAEQISFVWEDSKYRLTALRIISLATVSLDKACTSRILRNCVS